LSERYVDDADWATAAEQSSEDDEAQEGNILAEEDRANTPAEHLAVHIVDEDEDGVADLDDIDIDDPEADAIVNDALNIDRADEAQAAAEVLSDSLAEEVAAYAAVHADDVTPYDGPDINGDEDEPVLDADFVAEVDAAAGVVDDVEASVSPADAATVEGDLDVADAEGDAGIADADADADASDADDEDAEEDPYEAFRAELRALPGKWYVIHSYAGFERKVKANIEQRKSTLEVEEDIYQIEVPMEDVV